MTDSEPISSKSIERDIRRHNLPNEVDALNDDIDKLTEIVQLAAVAIGGLKALVNDLQQRVNFLEDYLERTTGEVIPKP